MFPLSLDLDVVDIEICILFKDDIIPFTASTFLCILLVDLGSFWQLAVLFQITGLFHSVLDDNIRLVVLEVTQRDQNDITVVNPDLVVAAAGGRGGRVRYVSDPIMLAVETGECDYTPSSSSFLGCEPV